ncbi:hypothetical protein FRC03_001650 [Tulasnella sp. 419]|nr:hypothetical protein FRC03_001650 [Tulasnella sp. 419]
MSISPGSVHNQSSWIFTDSLGECFGTLLHDDVTPTNFTWDGSVEWWAIRIFTVLKSWNDDFSLDAGFADLTFDAASVDGEVSEVCQEFLSTVLSNDEFEEIGCIVDELKNEHS